MIFGLQILLVVTSVLVVLLVLLHRAKGGGLSTLFGGWVPIAVVRLPPLARIDGCESIDQSNRSAST